VSSRNKRVTKSLELAKESFKLMPEAENPFISDFKMDQISIEDQKKSVAEFGDGVRDDLDCSHLLESSSSEDIYNEDLN